MRTGASPEQALWQAVVSQAIIDAASRASGGLGGAALTELEKHKARTWFGSRDFRVACSLAGYEPEFVEDRVRPILSDPEAAAQFVRVLHRKQMGARVAMERRAVGSPGRPRIVPGGLCAVPGCGASLSLKNHVGVCRQHNHDPDFCRCCKCEAKR